MNSLCSQNVIQLEEKEKREKEMRLKIIEEAEEYKVAFYEKRKLNVETNKVQNKEREKVKFTHNIYVYFFHNIHFSVLLISEINFACGAVILGQSREIPQRG